MWLKINIVFHSVSRMTWVRDVTIIPSPERCWSCDAYTYLCVITLFSCRINNVNMHLVANSLHIGKCVFTTNFFLRFGKNSTQFLLNAYNVHIFVQFFPQRFIIQLYIFASLHYYSLFRYTKRCRDSLSCLFLMAWYYPGHRIKLRLRLGEAVFIDHCCPVSQSRLAAHI